MSATVASGRVFDAFLGADLGERTLYHGHSYSGNALAAAVALRHLELHRRVGRARQRARPLRRAAASCSTTASRRSPAVREVRLRGPDGRRRARAAAPTACAGAGGCRAAAVERGVLLRPIGDVVVLMPPLTITSEEIDRIVARCSPTRSTRSASGASG